MFLPAFSIALLSIAAHLNGIIATPVHWSLTIPVWYFVAMCIHDAVHRSAHENRRLNSFVGWVGSAGMGLAFPVIRRSHLKHHSRNGHDDDLESFVYRAGWMVLIKALLANWKCYAVLPGLRRRDRQLSILYVIAVAGMTVIWPIQVFLSWIVPMQIAIALFAIATVYLPHGRHSKWVMKHMPSITGYHDDHHNAPQYPWYQYFSLRRRKA